MKIEADTVTGILQIELPSGNGLVAQSKPGMVLFSLSMLTFILGQNAEEGLRTMYEAKDEAEDELGKKDVYAVQFFGPSYSDEMNVPQPSVN